MRRARFNLEDQVGGLVDHERKRERRRRTPDPVPDPVAAAPERYELTAPAKPSIRAGRADERSDRRVA